MDTEADLSATPPPNPTIESLSDVYSAFKIDHF
jgi:hypothetical protein